MRRDLLSRRVKAMLPLPSTLKFIAEHPLNRRRPVAALVRFAAWQLGSRFKTNTCTRG
jgi:hypothetical protein